MIRDTLFKYHAACYLTHAAIEAAGSLRQQRAVDPEKIAAVEVHVHPALLGVCNIEEPTTGLEGKFSLRATTALALLGRDTADPALYCDATMAEPELVALRDRVHVRATEEIGPTQARVVVEGPAGQSERTVDAGVPAADLAGQGQRLRRKFLALASARLGPAGAEDLARAVERVDHADSLRELLGLACTAAPA